MAVGAKKQLSEAELYPPVKLFLERFEYTVRGEVLSCDLVATRGDELVVVELKLSFTLPLVMQAIRRQSVTDSVYVAIPFPKCGRFTRGWRDMCRLLRRLELGLVTVRFGDDEPVVEVVLHPLPVDRRKNRKLERSIIREAGGRSGDYNVGGSTGKKLVTAYRESAIYVACCLERYGELSPAKLRELGSGPKTQAILKNNVYGWFERVGRGTYRLRADADTGLSEYEELAERCRSRIPTPDAAV